MRKYQVIEGGDHWILIGKVCAFDDIGRAPLLYHQGSYAAVIPHQRFPSQEQQETPGVKALQGRLNNSFYYLMTQAVRAYQADYQPLQLSTGLRTSEARMLMVLEQDRTLSIDDLLKEVNMPREEILNAAEILQRKGLISLSDEGYQITAQGLEQASGLWELAAQEQERVFSQFSDAELDSFRKVLMAII